jgi:hypothetical protein
MSEIARLGGHEHGTAARTRRANEVRGDVVRTLGSYIDVAARKQELEEAFLTRLLPAGYRLREAIDERRRLEAACRGIRAGIERGDYGDAGEIAAEVRRVLRHDAEPCDGSHHEEPRAAAGEPQDEPPDEPQDDGLDEAERRRILGDFKRIVLPKVHADTSEAPFEVFDAAHAAYRSKDHVLMEAFVIQYRGELAACDRDRLARYRSAARRLRRRLRLLRESMAVPGELGDAYALRRRIDARHKELRRAIDGEAERVLRLRACLESLTTETGRTGSE